MNFRAGDRVRVKKLEGADVDFTATLYKPSILYYNLKNCSESVYENHKVVKPDDAEYGKNRIDYYEHISDDTMTVRQFERLNPDVFSINRFINLVEKQRLKGLEKYRTSLEDAGLSVEELITHAEEEIVDNWNYLQAIRAQYRSEQS